jgi:hypothetical protein
MAARRPDSNRGRDARPRRRAARGVAARERTGAWSAPEVDVVRRHFALRDLAVLARRLRRSAASVRARARVLFHKRGKDEPWSPADDQRLRLSYGFAPDADVALALGRTLAATRARVRELGRRQNPSPWTSADDELLRKVYGSRTLPAVELCLQRPRELIEAAAARLRLGKSRRFLAAQRVVARMPRWNAAAVAELRRLYPDHDNLELARRLDRSVASIANKANLLGLRKRRQWLRQAGRAYARKRWSAAAAARDDSVGD